jgi:hypothetical protein
MCCYFSEPGKIDLEAFMNRNFHFDVSLERFAYLTGRSLSTLKRDFKDLYNLPPAVGCIDEGNKRLIT